MQLVVLGVEDFLSIYISSRVSLTQYSGNFVVLASLKICHRFRRHFKFISATALAPLSNNHSPHRPPTPALRTFFLILLNTLGKTYFPHRKVLIWRIYNAIPSMDNDSIDETISNLEQELGLRFGEGYCDGVVGRMCASSSGARLSLIQFKVVHMCQRQNDPKLTPLFLTCVMDVIPLLVI